MSPVLRKFLALAIVYLAALALYVWYLRAAPIMYLDAVIHSDRASTAEVYYASKGEVLSEQQSSRQTYREGETRLLLPIYHTSISTLRFDPSQSDNVVTISRLRVIDRVGVIIDNVALSRIRAGNQIADIRVVPNGLAISPTSAANDPYVFIDIGAGVAARTVGTSTWPDILLLSLLALPASWFLLGGNAQRNSRAYALLLAAIFSLVFVAANVMVTSRSVNPDEAMHIGAARFYLDNWLPPAIGDSRVASDPDAYGVWGFSYLDEWDICYFLAGKLAVVLAPFVPDETVRFRLFNVVLFGVLLRLFLCRRWAYPLAPLLLASPQIWYVFSYFNADAFALTISCVAVFYIADRDSFLLDNSTPSLRSLSFWKRHWRTLLLQALILALVILSKRNFWGIIPFVALIVLVRSGLIGWLGILIATGGLVGMSVLSLESQYSFLQPHVAMLRLAVTALAFVFLSLLAKKAFSRTSMTPEVRRTIAKLAALMTLALLISAPRILWDVAINGTPSEKLAKLTQNENQYAIPDLKPKTVREGKGLSTNRLMDRGVPLLALFGPSWNWQSATVNSMFGVYGYMQYLTASTIILILAICAAMTTMLSMWQIRREAGMTEVLVTLAMMFVVVANSLLASWIAGFQPQGRYLFPMLPFAFSHLNTRLPSASARTARFLTAVATAFGVCGFLGYGLSRLIR